MSPLAAIVGAGLAVSGVILGIGALLLVADGRTGDPTVSAALPSRDLQAQAEVPDEPSLPSGSAAGVPGTAPRVVAPARPAARPGVRPASPTARPGVRRATAARVPAPRPARPAVAVLNNSRLPGLAARASARFRRSGWPVSVTGDYRGRIRTTTVYYPPGRGAPARRFAAAFPDIARVLPRPPTMPGPPGLVVVVTRHFRP